MAIYPATASGTGTFSEQLDICPIIEAKIRAFLAYATNKQAWEWSEDAWSTSFWSTSGVAVSAINTNDPYGLSLLGPRNVTGSTMLTAYSDAEIATQQQGNLDDAAYLLNQADTGYGLMIVAISGQVTVSDPVRGCTVTFRPNTPPNG